MLLSILLDTLSQPQPVTDDQFINWAIGTLCAVIVALAGGIIKLYVDRNNMTKDHAADLKSIVDRYEQKVKDINIAQETKLQTLIKDHETDYKELVKEYRSIINKSTEALVVTNERTELLSKVHLQLQQLNQQQ